MAKKIIVDIGFKVDDAEKKKVDDAIKDLEQNPPEIPIKVVTEGSIAELKKLKKELRDTAAGSEEFSKLANQIDDLEEKIKGSKKASSDWVDQLASAPGPLGKVGQAINAVKEGTVSFGGALKATGIGLVVSALGLLIGAFKGNEEAMKKIQPLLDGFQKIFQGVFRAVEPLFNILVDLALKALPFVTDAIGTASAVVISFVKSLGSIASAVGKLLTGDFTGAWESAKEAVTSFGTNYTETKNSFISGSKEMTEHEKEEAEKRKKLLEEQAAKRKELREKEKAAADKAAAEEKKRKEDELADLQDFNAKVFAAQKQELDDKIANDLAAEEILKELNPETPAEKLKREYEEKKAILEAANKDTFELSVKYLSDVEALEQASKDKTTAITKKAAEDQAAIEQTKFNFRLQLFAQIGAAVGALGNLFKKNTAAAKVAALAEIAIGTAVGFIQGLDIAQKSAKATGPGAAFAFPIFYATQVIAVLAAAGKAKSALSGDGGGGGGGSAAAGTPSIPSNVVTPIVPSQSLLVGNSTNFNNVSGTQTVQGTQGQTITVNAVVSETQMTDTQNKIKQIQNNAELGG